MSESNKDTVLSGIADNVADSFFEGGASSNNVITASGEEPVTGKPEGEKVTKLDTFTADQSFRAEDLIGELLQTDDKVLIDTKPQENVNQTVEEPKIDFNFVIEDGILAGFEDDAPLKTKEDLAKLITANRTEWENAAKTKALEEEQSALPEELKYVLDYVKRGGDDLKTVFKLLSQTQELRDYDLTRVEDQKNIVRDYYEVLGWTEDEVEEELINLTEGKRLQTSAEKFKPKLDSIRRQELQEKEQAQAQIDEQRGKARRFFEDNVMNTLKGEKIGELKLNKEEKLDLFNALVKEQYQSFNGPTNRLGALLDRIQYVKPDYEHLMEVAMLLSNREGFKKKIKEQVTTEVTAEQVKKIKTEQQKQKIGSAHGTEKDTKRLPKLGSSFINPF